jgi:hypothetical protein
LRHPAPALAPPRAAAAQAAAALTPSRLFLFSAAGAAPPAPPLLPRSRFVFCGEAREVLHHHLLGALPAIHSVQRQLRHHLGDA